MGKASLLGILLLGIAGFIAPPVEAGSCNVNPEALNDNVTVINTHHLLDPLANDSDNDGNPLSVLQISSISSSLGDLDLQSDDTVLYTPSFCLSNTNINFTYTISDGQGGSDTGSVAVAISRSIVFCDGFESGNLNNWSASAP